MSCFLCGGTSGEVVWREAPYEARRCPCGVVYTTPAPPPEVAGDLRHKHAEPFYAAPADYRARWLAGVAPPPARVFEVGCGRGSQLEAFGRLGYGVAGIDADPDHANAAAERLGLSIPAISLEDFVPDARHDVVYHTDLLSHFVDPVGALRAMARIARPGGLVCFEVGLLTGGPHAWARWNRNPGLDAHRWFYTDAALRRTLARAGLDEVARAEFDLAPYILALRAIRTLRRRPAAPPVAGGRAADAERVVAGRAAAERALAFLRYRVGAVWPRFATGTLLLAARAPH